MLSDIYSLWFRQIFVKKAARNWLMATLEAYWSLADNGRQEISQT
jgi:hypothetical protein